MIFHKAFDAELNHWVNYWYTFTGSKPNNVANTLKSLPRSGFPNIEIALRILSTLPETSCECEWLFSA